MDEFQKQISDRYHQITEMIETKEREIKALRGERLPLADMLDKWGLVQKPRRKVRDV